MRVFRLVLILSVIYVTAFPGLSQALSIASYEEVKAAMGSGARLVDVRPEGQYKAGHLHGAVNLSFFEMMDDTQHLFSPEDMADILMDAGIGKSGTTIVYGSWGPPMMQASYLGWVMSYLGASDVRVYTGGVDDWAKHGGQLSEEEVTPPEAEFELEINANLRVDSAYINKHIKTGDITVVDTRGAGEFYGQDIRALRGGSIPGAVNMMFPSAYMDSNRENVVSPKALAANFYKIPKDKPVVLYCQTGARASLALLAFLHAGYTDVRLYPESWKDWGSNTTLPVENETYFDLTSITGAIDGLKSENSTLKSELQQTTIKAIANMMLIVIVCLVAYTGLMGFIAYRKEKLTPSLWIAIILASGLLGLLVGYGASSATGVAAPTAHVEESGGYK